MPKWEDLAPVLARINWPTAFLLIAGLLIYALLLAPTYVTPAEMREAIELHHPANDVRIGVHDSAIDRLTTEDTELRKDLRSMRRGP